MEPDGNAKASNAGPVAAFDGMVWIGMVFMVLTGVLIYVDVF